MQRFCHGKCILIPTYTYPYLYSKNIQICPIFEANARPYQEKTSYIIWSYNFFQESSTAPGPTPSPPNKCDYQGDTFCDDENNNEDCDYDGGDCCGENVKKDYCTVCECKGSAMAPCLM